MLEVRGQIVRAEGGRAIPGLQVRLMVSGERIGRMVGAGSDVSAFDGAFAVTADLSQIAEEPGQVDMQISVTGGAGGETLFESEPRSVLPTGSEVLRIPIPGGVLDQAGLAMPESRGSRTGDRGDPDP